MYIFEKELDNIFDFHSYRLLNLKGDSEILNYFQQALTQIHNKDIQLFCSEILKILIKDDNKEYNYVAHWTYYLKKLIIKILDLEIK